MIKNVPMGRFLFGAARPTRGGCAIILLMIILIDMDEVISDFEGGLRDIWEQKYPHTPLFKGGVRDTFYIGSGDDQGRSELVFKIIHSEGFFESLKPIQGAKEAIDEMHALGHYVFIVTSPGVSYPNAASEKYRWIEKHFGQYMLERLIITPAKQMVKGDFLIDDRPEFAYADYAEWEHVLYDRSYNKHIDGKRRLQWDTWKEVLPELLSDQG